VSAGRAVCGPVHLAWATSSRRPLPPESVLDAMGAPQRARFDRLDDVRAARFLVGRTLLAELIGSLTPGDVRVETRCARCGHDDHGRLTALSRRVALSVSYAGDVVIAAAAASPAVSAIGVDIEADRGDGPLEGLSSLFAPDDPPAVRDWTAIEAVVKADGRGLSIPPSHVVLSATPGIVLPHSRLATVPGRHGGFEVAPAAGPAGFAVSVAIDPASESGR